MADSQKPGKLQRRLTLQDVAAAATKAGMEQEAVQKLLQQAEATKGEKKDSDSDMDDEDDLEDRFAESHVSGKIPNREFANLARGQSHQEVSVMLHNRLRKVETLTGKIAEEIAKNTIRIVPFNKMAPKAFHAKDSQLVRAIKNKFKDNVPMKTTERLAVDLKFPDFTNPRSVNEEVKKVLEAAPDLRNHYKVGFKEALSMTLAKKPPNEAYYAIVSCYRYYKDDPNAKFPLKTLLPTREHLEDPRFSIETSSGHVFMTGDGSRKGLYSIAMVKELKINDVILKAEDVHKELGRIWTGTETLVWKTAGVNAELERAPVRSDSGIAQSKKH